MADEEQEMELEALEAIYTDDFQIVSNDVPRTCTIILHPEGVIDEETTTSTVSKPPFFLLGFSSLCG